MKIDQAAIDTELMRKIREIELLTRRMVKNTLLGNVRSSIKGSGFEFDQIREYQQGDDIRRIDWPASARMNTILVKQYIEEREQTVLIALDLSYSLFFGSTDQMKCERAARMAAIIAFIAHYNGSRVGLYGFTDTVHFFIPPRQGRRHLQEIVEKIFCQTPLQEKSSLTPLFQKLLAKKGQDGLLFIISDFIVADDYALLPSINRAYEPVMLSIIDEREKEMGAIGWLSVVDNETGQRATINFSNGMAHDQFLKTYHDKKRQFFQNHAIPYLDVSDEEKGIVALIELFKKKMRG